jgi:hypothetical protein
MPFTWRISLGPALTGGRTTPSAHDVLAQEVEGVGR